MPPGVQLALVQLPGREARLRERAFTDAARLADALTEALGPFTTSPYAFFGHSMGALLSYEVACRLGETGQPLPRRLMVAAHRAPSIPYPRDPVYDLEGPDLVRELVRLGGTPREILEHEELMELVLPTIRADMELCETYRYAGTGPLQVPISAFGGEQDGDVTRDHLEAWRQHTTGSFSLAMIPGDHFFIHGSKVRFLDELRGILEHLVAPVTQ